MNFKIIGKITHLCLTFYLGFFLGLIFGISLLIKIMELNPLYNNIQKVSNLDLSLRVFIHPRRIG